MAKKREVRYRLLPDTFDGKRWTYKKQGIVRLGEVGVWSMVRNAEFRDACPFVVSTKDWNKMEVANPESTND